MNQLVATQIPNPELPAVMDTNEAAPYICRKPQTMRKWACFDSAPMGIKPIRLNGRLLWRVTDLQKLLEG